MAAIALVATGAGEHRTVERTDQVDILSSGGSNRADLRSVLALEDRRNRSVRRPTLRTRCRRLQPDCGRAPGSFDTFTTTQAAPEADP
jgi:hypothetical protein